jgi:hypothetical protein
MGGISKMARLFKYIFSRKHLKRKCKTFIKITRLFEDIREGFQKKFEAFSKMTRLFEDTFNRIKAFLK